MSRSTRYSLLALLAYSSIVLGAAKDFSIHDDVLAYPQVCSPAVLL
jgi:hypothetical protein